MLKRTVTWSINGDKLILNLERETSATNGHTEEDSVL
jgi:hypothetical protein